MSVWKEEFWEEWNFGNRKEEVGGVDGTVTSINEKKKGKEERKRSLTSIAKTRITIQSAS